MSTVIAVPKVVCRQIEENDLDAVADLLVRGFPERLKAYWLTGFARLRARVLPPGYPRYGMMLDWCGKPVGVILLLFSTTEAGDGGTIRCNLSSWYVDPAYASHAGSLVLNCLRRRAVTYTNISPVPHTIAAVEAVKFVRYTTDYFLSVPALAGKATGSRIHIVRTAADAAAFAALPERDLLADHAAMGCLCVVVEQAGEWHPFVFLRFRVRAGRLPLPIQQLIFTRHLDDFVRFAGPLGRYLLRHGTLLVAFDTIAEQPISLAGLRRRQGAPKYFRGPNRPRLGDLAYTERVVFGP